MKEHMEKMIEQQYRKQLLKDKFKQSFFWFTLFGLGFMAGHTLLEILYGTGYTHPIWVDNFSWPPLIVQVVAVSFMSSVIYSVAGTNAVMAEPRTINTKLRPRFNFNYERPPAFTPLKTSQ